MGCGGSKGGSVNGGALSPGRKSVLLITSRNNEGKRMQINGGGSFRSCQGDSKEVEGIFVIAEEKSEGIAFEECATDGYLLPRREEKEVDVVAGGEDGEYYSPVHELLRKSGDDVGDDDGGDVSDSVTREISEDATVRKDELK